jgi:hypothetical protein
MNFPNIGKDSSGAYLVLCNILILEVDHYFIEGLLFAEHFIDLAIPINLPIPYEIYLLIL